WQTVMEVLLLAVEGREPVSLLRIALTLALQESGPTRGPRRSWARGGPSNQCGRLLAKPTVACSPAANCVAGRSGCSSGVSKPICTASFFVIAWPMALSKAWQGANNL